MGWQHAIAGGQGNLVAVSVQSPNFVTTISGWQVRRDGSAEFNNVTIRGGVVVGGTSLQYAGVPAFGNLIESSSSTNGTDPFGNAYLAGEVTYRTGGTGDREAFQKSGYTLAWYTAPTAAGPWTAGSEADFQQQYVLFRADLLIASTNITEPSGDTSGVADTTKIQARLTNGISCYLTKGTYYINATLAIPQGTSIYGDGPGTIIVPVAALAGGVLSPTGTLNQGCRISDLQIWGGTTTRGSNPAADAIYIPAGSQNIWVSDVLFNYNNGWCINGDSITAGLKGTFRGLKGTNNAGGIRLITSATGISIQAEIADVNLQRSEVNECLYLQHVFDVLCKQFNAATLGTAGAPTVHLLGKCTTCKFSQMDCGVIGTPTAGVPVLHLEDSGGASVTDCGFSDSTFQAGALGIVVDGGTARSQFSQVSSRNNTGDGWQFNGTGTALAVANCLGNGNGGTADVNVTGAAHVGLEQFAYCSSGVTNSLVVPITNHVSNNNPTSPGGKAVSGTPAGW